MERWQGGGLGDIAGVGFVGGPMPQLQVGGVWACGGVGVGGGRWGGGESEGVVEEGGSVMIIFPPGHLHSTKQSQIQ